MIKIKIFKEWEIDPSGFSPVWSWLCDSGVCEGNKIAKGSTIFWENAVRGASHHIKWHEQFYKVGG